MSRRQMKPLEVLATLLTAKQLRVVWDGPQPTDGLYHATAEIFCKRTGERITLENVKRVQVEHWPIRHKHNGPVSPDNAIISLKEGHAMQTKREKKADAKEDRIRRGRKVMVDLSKKAKGKPTGTRLKKKMDGRVVRVPTYD